MEIALYLEFESYLGTLLTKEISGIYKRFNQKTVVYTKSDFKNKDSLVTTLK